MTIEDKKKTPLPVKPQLVKPHMGKPRVGVYICHCGGNISDVVDVEQVAQALANSPDVQISRRNMFMCSDPGQKMITQDIEKENLDRVVVAACSPSLHEKTFRGTLARAGLNPYLYEHANIREQVSWCSKSDPSGATRKALQLASAAVGKAKKLKPLEKIRVEAKRHVAVIGGGVSGLRAACDLSRRGMKVTLLERSPFLGGRMAQLGELYPTGENARQLLDELLNKITNDPLITIYTGAEVIAASGYMGNFHLEVRLHPRGVTKDFDLSKTAEVIASCPEEVTDEFAYKLDNRKAFYIPYEGAYPPLPAIDQQACTRCKKCLTPAGNKGIDLREKAQDLGFDTGALLIATGFDPYEPQKGEYAYQEFPEVVTLPQLIRLLDDKRSSHETWHFNQRPIKNICFIHCVGSRQVEGIHQPRPDGKINNYCSRVCCTATLQAACEIKKRFPEVNVYDFYQDIRTYGRGHEDYYEQASKSGVLFFRWVADAPPLVSKGENGSPLQVSVKDTLTFNEDIEVPADLVVLSTGMEPREISSLVEMLKLPRSADGFLQEVHPKLRPVEMAIGGVMIAGTCQAPMDITESTAAAAAAAVKAAALLAKGYIELEPFVASVDLKRCMGGKDCGLECIDECKAMQALSLVEKEINGAPRKVAEVNQALCNGCGMCVAVCPLRAIQLAGWQLDQFQAMVEAIVMDPMDTVATDAA